MTDVFITIAMIASTGLLWYVTIALLIFVVGYYVFFDPRATTAGKQLFRFMVSLAGIFFLTAVGGFVRPLFKNEDGSYTGFATFWAALAVLICLYVAFTITTLSVSLVMRKWFPSRVKKVSDLTLLKPRNDTNEIHVIHTVKSD